MSIRCDEFHRCLTVEIRDEASEVLWKAQEFEYAGQLSVVRRGEGTLEVKVAEDDVLLVGVSVLRIEA